MYSNNHSIHLIETLRPVNGSYMKVVSVVSKKFGLIKVGRHTKFIFRKKRYIFLIENTEDSLIFIGAFRRDSVDLKKLNLPDKAQIDRRKLNQTQIVKTKSINLTRLTFSKKSDDQFSPQNKTFQPPYNRVKTLLTGLKANTSRQTIQNIQKELL